MEARHLRKAIEENRWSHKYIAEQTGISTGTIYRYTSGKQEIPKYWRLIVLGLMTSDEIKRQQGKGRKN